MPPPIEYEILRKNSRVPWSKLTLITPGLIPDASCKHHDVFSVDDVSIACCDGPALQPLRLLVQGPLQEINQVVDTERLIRAILLHDEIYTEGSPIRHNPGHELMFVTEGNDRPASPAISVGPEAHSFDFVTGSFWGQQPPEIELTSEQVHWAAESANAGPGSPFFDEHIRFLKSMYSVSLHGGSLIMSEDFPLRSIERACRFPKELFSQLDQEWQDLARHIEEDGSGLLLPPVLSIVLTNCATRDDIPAVIKSLRNDWSAGRRALWKLIRAKRTARNVKEYLEISREVGALSSMFSPKRSDLDIKPLRVFWEIVTSGTAAVLTGGFHGLPGLAAAANQVGRNVPALLQEFGAQLFGRGAFDLGRTIRRALSSAELDPLRRLISTSERARLAGVGTDLSSKSQLSGSTSPPPPFGLEEKEFQDAEALSFDLQCASCETMTSIQVNFREHRPIGEGMVSFPKDNKLKCPKCGVEHDLSPIRRQLESHLNKTIV